MQPIESNHRKEPVSDLKVSFAESGAFQRVFEYLDSVVSTLTTLHGVPIKGEAGFIFNTYD